MLKFYFGFDFSLSNCYITNLMNLIRRIFMETREYLLKTLESAILSWNPTDRTYHGFQVSSVRQRSLSWSQCIPRHMYSITDISNFLIRPSIIKLIISHFFPIIKIHKDRYLLLLIVFSTSWSTKGFFWLWSTKSLKKTIIQHQAPRSPFILSHFPHSEF